jgi:hypothetical protein
MLYQRVFKVNQRLGELYDQIFQPTRINRLERYIVYLALLGLFAHLLLIYLSRAGFMIPRLPLDNTSYLAAVSTPFTIILFFELLLLIQSIPESITRSIGRQFEIISLITILGVFKDFSHLESTGAIDPADAAFRTLIIDFVGAVGMYLLVTVFYHIKSKRSPHARRNLPPGVLNYVFLKKSAALIMSVVFFMLVSFNGWRALFDLLGGRIFDIEIFFVQLFTLMIFSDVFLLVLSYLYTSHYELLFRNIGFVLSTVLIRFSLTIPKPYDVLLALTGMLLGIVICLIYNYFTRVQTHDPNDADAFAP